MAKIILLDNELANQIAAGEVIERPSSVVKELVENSIDAGATKIDVFINEAGRKAIIVQDNGSGIPSDELALAFSRHATSKIHSTFDLFRIRTLGFRGEALPSIASIAKVQVETAEKGKPGALAKIENGDIKIEPSAVSSGTKITVSELFYNTPARLKYLKRDYTENAVTLEMCIRDRNTKIDEEYEDLFSDVKDEREYLIAARLVSYLTRTKKRQLSYFKAITVTKPQSFLQIDAFSRLNLELTKTIRNETKYGSLFWLLDETTTAMGRRKLKDLIIRPSRDYDEIIRRQNIVNTFIVNFVTRAEVKEHFVSIYDLERIVARLSLIHI